MLDGKRRRARWRGARHHDVHSDVQGDGLDATPSRARWSTWCCLLVLTAGAPAVRGPAVAQSRAGGAAADTMTLPPAWVTAGPALPAGLVIGIRRAVADAVAETHRQTQAARGRGASKTPAGGGPAGRWPRLMCELHDVRIELESGEFPNSSVAATVLGRARVVASRQAATPAGARRRRDAARAGTDGTYGAAGTATVAFALLYVHPAPTTDYERGGSAGATLGVGWRLTLARVRPEPDAASPQGQPDWQELWSGAPGGPSEHPCVLAAIWRGVGGR